MGVLPRYMPMYHLSSFGDQKRCQTPLNTDCCELPCGYWGSDLCPLEEQTTVTYFSSLPFFFNVIIYPELYILFDYTFGTSVDYDPVLYQRNLKFTFLGEG